MTPKWRVGDNVWYAARGKYRDVLIILDIRDGEYLYTTQSTDGLSRHYLTFEEFETPASDEEIMRLVTPLDEVLE